MDSVTYINAVLTLDSLKEYKNKNMNKNIKKNTKKENSNIVLVFDTETTGLVNSRMIQLSFVLYDTDKGEVIFFSEKNKDYILLPEFYNNKTINEKWLLDRPRIEDELLVLINELESQKQNLSRDEYKKKRECLEKSAVSYGNNIIPFSSTISHQIFDSTLYKYGRDLNISMNEFIKYFYMAGRVVGHNIAFDIKMICTELIHLLDEKYIKITDKERISYIQLFYELIENVYDGENIKDLNFHKERTKLFEMFLERNRNKLAISNEGNKNNDKRLVYCTMKNSTMICRLRQAFGYKKIYSANELIRLEGSLHQLWKLYKSPQLIEAHKILFSQNVRGELHNSRIDVAVTLRVFMKIYKNIDICNYISRRVNNGNQLIYHIIKPEDITDARDFPTQLFFKKMEDHEELFTIDTSSNRVNQTKEMIYKTEENRLRDIRRDLNNLLRRKIMSAGANAIEENVKEVVVPLLPEETIIKYNKANPRRNPRRNKKLG